MKKIIRTALFLVVLIPAHSYATCSIDEAINYQWGVVADTFQGKITSWRHATDPQPSQAEIDTAVVNCTKSEAKSDKLSELNDKGVEHICRTAGLCYDSWNALVIAYNDWLSIAPASRQATAAKSKAIDHYQPWSDARTTINNYTGIGSTTFFNVSTMVSWP